MESIQTSNSAITGAIQKVGDSLSLQHVTIAELSATASDLNQSAEELSTMVRKFNIQENR